MIGEAEWRTHAELVGQVMLAWSRNTHQLLRVFTHITGLGSPMAETLFFSHTSDAGQRKMLLDLAAAMELSPGPADELKGIFKRLEKIAGLEDELASLSTVTDDVGGRLDDAIGEIRAALARS